MSDSNRGSLLSYERTAGTNSGEATKPRWQIRGPATGMMFIAGVALDPLNREVFTVDNDIGDRMEVFPYGLQGNVKPKRVLHVPHGSWGVSLNRRRDEIAISVEHINSVVIYRRDSRRQPWQLGPSDAPAFRRFRQWRALSTSLDYDLRGHRRGRRGTRASHSGGADPTELADGNPRGCCSQRDRGGQLRQQFGSDFSTDRPWRRGACACDRWESDGHRGPHGSSDRHKKR